MAEQQPAGQGEKTKIDLLQGACFDGNLAEVENLLSSQPNLDINFKSLRNGWTALHWACVNGHVDVVKALLRHPKIHVNAANSIGNTPFLLSCSTGCTDVVTLLLRDSRLICVSPNVAGDTPFRSAAGNGHVLIVMWLLTVIPVADLAVPDAIIVSGSPQRKIHEDLADYQDRCVRCAAVADLLTRFLENPGRVRHQIRLTLRLQDEIAVELFAMVVFLCDGLLKPITDTPPPDLQPASRFFAIVSRLPIELQMIVCCRACGSLNDSILKDSSEAGFKALIRAVSS